jgi:hypothetical protein
MVVKKLNRKGQLKIQQMAFVLIAITIFFVMVGLLFLVIQGAGLRGKFSEIQEENAKALVVRLANSPELSCGSAFDESKSNCVDADKAMIFNLDSTQENYKRFWKVAEIEVLKTYERQKETGREIECTFGNYPNCNQIKIYKRELPEDSVAGPFISNYVSLCRQEQFEGKTYPKCEIALLSVKYEIANEKS